MTTNRDDIISLIKRKVNSDNFLVMLNNHFANIFQHSIIVKHIGDNALTITYSNIDNYNQYNYDLLDILSNVFPKIRFYRILQSIGHLSLTCYYIF